MRGSTIVTCFYILLTAVCGKTISQLAKHDSRLCEHQNNEQTARSSTDNSKTMQLCLLMNPTAVPRTIK